MPNYPTDPTAARHALVEAWPDAGWIPADPSGKRSWCRWEDSPPYLDTVRRHLDKGAALQIMPAPNGLLVIDSDYPKTRPMVEPGSETDVVAEAAFAIFCEPLAECRTPGGGWHGYVEQVLAQTLMPGDIVILDNLPAHNSRLGSGTWASSSWM